MNSRLEWSQTFKRIGAVIGRAGMSKRVFAAIADFDGSYKGAMRLAGRCKAISQMAASDEYWGEQVDAGYHQERANGEALSAKEMLPLGPPSASRLTGALPALFANAVSDAIRAALERGMETDEACCIAAGVAADYARGAYGSDYLHDLAAVVIARAGEPEPLNIAKAALNG